MRLALDARGRQSVPQSPFLPEVFDINAVDRTMGSKRSASSGTPTTPASGKQQGVPVLLLAVQTFAMLSGYHTSDINSIELQAWR
jgi:hypothetical protein